MKREILNKGMIRRAAMMLLLCVFTMTVQTAWAEWTGTGTEANPYIISTPEDLLLLAHRVNGTSGETANDYWGKYFKLGADITFTHPDKETDDYAENYEAIGGYIGGTDRYFRGTFDGANHTVSGIRIRKTGSGYANYYQGLFGQTSDANIRNVHLTDARIKGFHLVGGIIGANIGTVSGCTVTDSYITAKGGYGTICGGNASIGTLTNNYYHGCTVNGQAVTSGVGCNGADITANNGALPAYAITFGDGVTIQTPMAADLGFTCDADNNGTAENYWRTGAQLTLSHADREGYTFGGYTVNGTAIDGNTFTMPDENVTIAATVSIDPAQFSVNGAGTEYTIHTAGGWNVFCDLLANNAKGFFTGKTVVLANDITVTRMAGGSNHAFTGTFDGQGHTLTVNYGTADEPVNEEFVAPFVEVTGGAKFTNLNIGGHIYAAYTGTDDPGTGGLIGHLFGGITIEDCTSTVTVNSTKDRVGGFVGLCEHAVTFTNCKSSASVTCTGSGSGFVGWSRASKDPYTIAFEGCLFDGKVLKKNDVGSGNGGFVGWTGSTKTVSIQNSLVALDGVGSMASGNSTTFARGWDGTFDNSFYTQPFGTAQGKQAHTVTADDNVTIEAIALTGTATQYTVSGITAYSGGGLQRGKTLYYGSDDQLSLILSAPLGYRYDGYTAYTASAGTLSGTTLTMPDENVTISVNTAAILSTGQPVNVAYIKADGTTQTTQAVALDGHEAVGEDDFVHLAAGTYYVGTDITYANQIRPDGDVTLILADRKTMTLNGNTMGIYGYNLTIYGQSLDAATAGTLRYNGSSRGINMSNYEQHSGNVSITTTGSQVYGIDANVTLRGGTLTISVNGYIARAIYGYTHSILGGQLTATATGAGAIGIKAFAVGGTDITLGWTRPADRITASSISANGGTVAVATGKALTDGSGHIYTGTLSADALDDKTLQPCLALADAADNTAAIAAHADQTLAVALSGRTLYKDGAWNTFCLPFDVTVGSGQMAGATAMTLNGSTSGFDSTSGVLTLNFTSVASGNTIAAGTPFIVKWNNTGETITAPVFEGVTVSSANNDVAFTGGAFKGSYSYMEWAAGTEYKSILLLGANSKLFWPNGENVSRLGACRAYFELSDGVNARAFVLNFNGDATGVRLIDNGKLKIENEAGAWYTLDGRKLDAQPTKAGLYIHGGRKVVVK